MYFYLFSLYLCFILSIFPVGCFIVLYVRISGYLKATGFSFLSVLLNTGRYGEALLFSMLDSRKGQKYILPNVYLNTCSGPLTEIDLILITHKGLFVFESKNYSGKIMAVIINFIGMYIIGEKSIKFTIRFCRIAHMLTLCCISFQC